MPRTYLNLGSPGTGGADLPSFTRLPFEAPGAGVTVVVDDENVRLTAELELGQRVPDYTALAGRCAEAFGFADVHVFATRALPAPRRPRPAGARVVTHQKEIPGKNTDVEATIWLVQNLDPAQAQRANLLLVSGDVDYLALFRFARDLGVNTGFLAAPGRSVAGALRGVPLGFLGADVLRRFPDERWDRRVPTGPVARRPRPLSLTTPSSPRRTW